MNTRMIAAVALAGMALAPSAARAGGHIPAEQDGTTAGITFFPSPMPFPFSEAVQVGEVLYLSGMIGSTDDGSALVDGGIEGETRRIFEHLKARLARAGLGYDAVFKCTAMLADMGDWPAFNAVYGEYFAKDRYPARSALGVNGLALGARVELECLAYKPNP